LNFNSVPTDQPGRYFYLLDRESGDYWSASWQPVGKPLDQYQSTCRHGTAYSIFESRYAGIASEATYFVPLGQAFEYWRLKITKESDRQREISLFSFCEFSNQWETYQDRVNLQYSLFIVRGELTEDHLLRIAIQDNLHHVNEGVVKMSIDGQEMAGNLIPVDMSGDEHQVEVWLGK
jgi:N,N'-diacetylchitobiose phosphorylase